MMAPLLLDSFESPLGARIHSRQETEDAAAALQAEEERKLAEAAEQARLAHQATLVSAIGALADTVQTVRDETVTQLEDSIQDALGQLFPALADIGFAAEIAAATARVIAEGSLAEAALCVTEDHHQPIVDALAMIGTSCPITVTIDPAQAPGTARLTWTNGGAEFDQTKMIGAAKDCIARHIQQFSRSSEDHE